MKRNLLAALAMSALALAVPGSALAHHSTHHARHHKHHAHAVRFLAGPVTQPKTTTAVKTTATTVTTTTTTEMPGESVGTVLSFEAGVLKITLGDGSVVSGKVTENTRLSCASATEGQDGSEGDDNGDEGHQGSSQGEDHGSGGPGQSHGDDMSQGSGHEDDEAGMEEPACTVAALVAGANVQEAELTLTSTGAVWEKVSL
jgi:hypothetical protein